MADLPQLILLPLRDSYDLTFGDDVVTTEYSDGMPRQRLDSTGRPHRTPIAFRNRAAAHDYLLAFWRTYRARPFAMRLYSSSSKLEWHECRFLGNPNQKEIVSQLFDWSCEVVVKPKPLNLEMDKIIVAIYEQTGGCTDTFFNLLEKLVNVDLPNATANL